jgi:hypothetical protein
MELAQCKHIPSNATLEKKRKVNINYGHIHNNAIFSFQLASQWKITFTIYLFVIGHVNVCISSLLKHVGCFTTKTSKCELWCCKVFDHKSVIELYIYIYYVINICNWLFWLCHWPFWPSLLNWSYWLSRLGVLIDQVINQFD